MKEDERSGGLPAAITRALAYEKAQLLNRSIIRKVPDHPTLLKYADDMRGCGLAVLLRHFHETGRIQAKSMNSCRHRGCCCFCAIRTARKNAGELASKLEQLHPWRFQLVTITQPNIADWCVGLDYMQETHKRFMKAWRNGRNRLTMESCFNHYLGGLYHLELKAGSGSGLAHPHIHYLMHGKGMITTKDWVLSGKDPRHHPLSIELSQRNPLGGFICDVRDIQADDVDELRLALMEVCKYVHDFKMGASEVWEVQKAILGRRLTGSFGSLRGLKLDKNPDDVISHDEIEGFMEHILLWDGSCYSMEEGCLETFNDIVHGG